MALVQFPHHGLSPAELSAARLDGELCAVGDGYAPADALETPALRAATLLPLLGVNLVAIGMSAAWVHGAIGVPPQVHHVQRGARGVTRPVDRRMRFRDTPLDDADVVVLGGARISSPARTLVDLTRDPSDPATGDAAERLATAPLIAEALAWLVAHRRMPGRQPAMAHLARLDRQLAARAEARQDEVTR
ncbi:hypothetical protein [Microbacterium sp. NPDC096154]|uniref:hypothetical protein n=1 Tax=Microbacterium sp. NPDC096154 TaxID=3155549 RepID=UPI0033318E25